MPKAKKKVAAKKKSVSKKKVVKKAVKKTARKKSVAARKSKKVTFLPKGYNVVTPYLIVSNGSDAIQFYKKIFGAKEVMRLEHNGKVMHAELKFGDTRIMLADNCPEMNAHSPEKFGGSSVGIHLYIKNVDVIVERALAHGAKLERPLQNMFYGDRNASLVDPFGHKWTVSTHIEDVTPAKAKKRMAELLGSK